MTNRSMRFFRRSPRTISRGLVTAIVILVASEAVIFADSDWVDLGSFRDRKDGSTIWHSELPGRFADVALWCKRAERSIDAIAPSLSNEIVDALAERARDGIAIRVIVPGAPSSDSSSDADPGSTSSIPFREAVSARHLQSLLDAGATLLEASFEDGEPAGYIVIDDDAVIAPFPSQAGRTIHLSTALIRESDLAEEFSEAFESLAIDAAEMRVDDASPATADSTLLTDSRDAGPGKTKKEQPPARGGCRGSTVRATFVSGSKEYVDTLETLPDVGDAKWDVEAVDLFVQLDETSFRSEGDDRLSHFLTPLVAKLRHRVRDVYISRSADVDFDEVKERLARDHDLAPGIISEGMTFPGMGFSLVAFSLQRGGTDFGISVLGDASAALVTWGHPVAPETRWLVTLLEPRDVDE